jgi:hypothetical protein
MDVDKAAAHPSSAESDELVDTIFSSTFESPSLPYLADIPIKPFKSRKSTPPRYTAKHFRHKLTSCPTLLDLLEMGTSICPMPRCSPPSCSPSRLPLPLLLQQILPITPRDFPHKLYQVSDDSYQDVLGATACVFRTHLPSILGRS